jgi:hypothetical protein
LADLLRFVDNSFDLVARGRYARQPVAQDPSAPSRGRRRSPRYSRRDPRSCV